jgi:hypothetical protein
MSIHSRTTTSSQFGSRNPLSRGNSRRRMVDRADTGLDPAMTLGCGWGGNITSDNISPRHLLNLKRWHVSGRLSRVACRVRPPRPRRRHHSPPACPRHPAAWRLLRFRPRPCRRASTSSWRLEGSGRGPVVAVAASAMLRARRRRETLPWPRPLRRWKRPRPSSVRTTCAPH